MAQDTSRGISFALKTSGDPAALTNSVRGVIAQVDRELPVFDVETMDQLTQKSLFSRRSPVVLSLSFGVIALFLSAIGIFCLASDRPTRCSEAVLSERFGSKPAGSAFATESSGWLSIL